MFVSEGSERVKTATLSFKLKYSLSPRADSAHGRAAALAILWSGEARFAQFDSYSSIAHGAVACSHPSRVAARLSAAAAAGPHPKHTPGTAAQSGVRKAGSESARAEARGPKDASSHIRAA